MEIFENNIAQIAGDADKVILRGAGFNPIKKWPPKMKVGRAENPHISRELEDGQNPTSVTTPASQIPIHAARIRPEEQEWK